MRATEGKYGLSVAIGTKGFRSRSGAAGRLLVCAVLAITVCLQPCDGAQILSVNVFPGRSHWMMISAILEGLLDRGHEVTVITNYPRKEPHPNLTEIVIAPIYDFWGKSVKVDSLYDLTDISIHQMLMDFLYPLGLETAEYAFSRKNVMNFLRNDRTQFDLLLAEQFYQEAYLMLAHKYKVPIVSIGTFGFAQYMGPMMGLMNAWSHVPHEFLPYTDHMTLPQRAYNSLVSTYELLLRSWYYLPQQEAMVAKYFSFLPGPLPSLSELEKQVSVILLNSYPPLTTTRAKVPGLVQVGGLHIKPPKPLPQDLKTFIDGAKDGVIYFSLGTNLRSADLPPEKLAVILKVFGAMKQRVVWKFEDERIQNLPSNVMVRNWLPQSDILGHRNVKVFITHGGLLGTQEGVHRAVPMVGIPIYCDQHLNMNKATLGGYAVKLYFPNITEESFRWALEEVLYNPSYKANMKRVSQIFRDRPVPALEESIYWIEYVIRHKGAPQLRSAGLDLPWVSFALLDLIGLAVVVLLVVLIVFRKIAARLFGVRKGKSKRKHE
ncbi:UDP-glycosyltransferase UGT5-like [Anopheles nili]|uniref:UDP-glycosyltransferase UGT5-like n=1 Tax=Anopheles nili TaxID=185578 RepID=UPI00237C165D|nr:UDP-glycosyltransferase UGT5-like [Anopheles nili]